VNTAVLTRDDGPVRTVTLNRPERRNALGTELFAQLEGVVAATAAWGGKVVVLEGNGPGFCAGADRKEPSSLSGSWQAARIELDRWSRCLDLLERLPQVTVASLHGAVVGGGAVLAAACDLRIAESDLQLSLPEVRLGLPLAMGGIARLAREIGLPRARELVLTGRVLDAATCLSWGLVHRVGDRSQLLPELLAELSAAAPAPLSMAKHSLSRLGRGADPRDGLWSDADVLSLMRRSAPQPA
jgi:enoyl-CoA hydratase/carnithine racemase